MDQKQIALRESIPPPTRLTSNEGDLGFELGFSDWSRSGFSPDHFQNVVDPFRFWVNHFAVFREKRLVTAWEILIKSPKMPYPAMLRQAEKWSGIRIRDRITTKS